MTTLWTNMHRADLLRADLVSGRVALAPTEGREVARELREQLAQAERWRGELGQAAATVLDYYRFSLGSTLNVVNSLR